MLQYKSFAVPAFLSIASSLQGKELPRLGDLAEFAIADYDVNWEDDIRSLDRSKRIHKSMLL